MKPKTPVRVVRVTLNDAGIRWLTERRIFLGTQGNQHLKAGKTVSFRNDLELEPYTVFSGCEMLHPLGAFSYLNSNVPAWGAFKSIGRYCSIATGLSVPGPRHPVEFIPPRPTRTKSTASRWRASWRTRASHHFPFIAPGRRSRSRLAMTCGSARAPR
jgi:hypothetical protein